MHCRSGATRLAVETGAVRAENFRPVWAFSAPHCTRLKSETGGTQKRSKLMRTIRWWPPAQSLSPVGERADVSAAVCAHAGVSGSRKSYDCQMKPQSGFTRREAPRNQASFVREGWTPHPVARTAARRPSPQRGRGIRAAVRMKEPNKLTARSVLRRCRCRCCCRLPFAVATPRVL